MKSFKIVSLLTVDAMYGVGMIIPSSLGEDIPGTDGKTLQAPRLENGEWTIPLPEELKNNPSIGLLVPFAVAQKGLEDGWDNLIKWDDNKAERWGEQAVAPIQPNWIKAQHGLTAVS